MEPEDADHQIVNWAEWVFDAEVFADTMKEILAQSPKPC